ncbi:MAG: BamA/TamA family outer membrane protein [Zoogloeaceae bacterium]|jgi:translocation and assembly module TamA|nr:BamA/TamA family outer membrane protein [Zoogloeaceae bacterium]
MFATRGKHLLFSLLLCIRAALPAWAGPPRLALPDDARDALHPLLQRYLHLEAPRDAVERDVLEARLIQQVRALLETEGYFDARVALTGPLDALVLTVTPGARSLVENVRVRIDGPVSPERREALRAAWTLGAGQPFRQADWDAAKERLLQGLLERDFPTARLSASEALVDASRHRVALEVVAESGPPYRFGAFEISGLARYPSWLVERYNDSIEPGAPYVESAIFELQNTLENTPYFSSVLLRLDTDATGTGDDGSRVAPVRVDLREEAPHRAGLGVGVSSNTGLRLETNFQTADFLHRAWQFTGGLRLEQLRQSLFADVFLPPSADPKYRHLHAFGMLLEHSDIQDLELKTVSLGLNRRQKWQGIDLTLSLGYLAEKQTPRHQGSERTRALTVNSVWNRQRAFTEGGGSVTQWQVGGAIRPVSTQNFARFYGRQQYAFNLGRRNTLHVRAEGGIVLASQRKGIPQNFLFRAGGSNSVRGYAYQSLGVQEGNVTLGGRYLLALSGELIHWLADSPWGIAVFADAGNAGDDRETFRLKTGYGVGARWNSPAGALGVDLAHGDRWRLHFAFSIPF